MALSAATRDDVLDEVLALDCRAKTHTGLRSVPDAHEVRRDRVGCGETGETGVFELVRTFVEHMIDDGSKGRESAPATDTLDWDTVRASVAGSRSLEQAAGRAVLVALRMRRETVAVANCDVLSPISRRDALSERPDTAAWCIRTDEPFFAFSVADVVPDFGDQSRYRSKVARRVARVIGIGRRPDEIDDAPAAQAWSLATTVDETPQ